MIGVIIFLVSAYLGGWIVLTKVKETLGLTIWQILGLSWGTGLGILVGIMYIYSLAHISWNIWLILLPYVSILLVFVYRNKNVLRMPSFKIPNDSISRVLLFVLLIAFLTVFLEAISHPVIAWDAIASWYFTAKGFFLSGGIDPSFIQFSHNSTPPFLHMVIALSYLFAGEIQDTYSLAIYPAFYLSLLCLFYGTIRREATQKIALFATVLLATLPDIMRHAGRYDVGNADLPLSYFFLCTCVFLLICYHSKSIMPFIFASCFAVIGAVIKPEGIPFLLVIELFIFTLLVQKKKHRYMPLLLVTLLPFIFWQIYVVYYHLPMNPFLSGGFHIQRLIPVLIAAFLECINIARWNLLWIVFFFVLLIGDIKRYWSITVIILFQLAIYLCIYLFTPLDPISHLHNSFDRLLLHIAPLAMLVITYQTIICMQRRNV